jgi:hypothetical protein
VRRGYQNDVLFGSAIAPRFVLGVRENVPIPVTGDPGDPSREIAIEVPATNFWAKRVTRSKCPELLPVIAELTPESDFHAYGAQLVLLGAIRHRGWLARHCLVFPRSASTAIRPNEALGVGFQSTSRRLG